MASIQEGPPDPDSANTDAESQASASSQASADDGEAIASSNQSDAGTENNESALAELEEEPPSVSGQPYQPPPDTDLDALPPDHPLLERAQQALRKQLQETLLDFRGKLKEKQVALKVGLVGLRGQHCSWRGRCLITFSCAGHKEEKGGRGCGPLWATGAACEGTKHNRDDG